MPRMNARTIVAGLVLAAHVAGCAPARALTETSPPERDAPPVASPDAGGPEGVSPKPEPEPEKVLAAQQPPALPDPYPEGESLRYKVKLKGFYVGTATMTVGAREKIDGRETVRLALRMVSNAFLSLFYEVDDRATSIVDVATGGTLRFRFDKCEKKKRETETFTADPETHEVASVIRKPSEPDNARRLEPGGPVQDVLSMFYEFRRLRFERGTFEKMTVLSRHKIYPLVLAADGLEQVTVRGVGTFWAIVVHPAEGMPGLVSGDGEATIWIEETTRVMLRMVAKGRKGTAELMLIGVETSPLLDAPGAIRRGK